MRNANLVKQDCVRIVPPGQPEIQSCSYFDGPELAALTAWGPNVTFLMLGTNDCKNPREVLEQHFTEDLKALIEIVRRGGGAVVLGDPPGLESLEVGQSEIYLNES